MHHGSPLLLSLFGPLTVQSIVIYLSGVAELKGNLIICYADILSACLFVLQVKLYRWCIDSLKSLDIVDLLKISDLLSSGDIAALVYLWNPFTIAACVGILSIFSVENLVVILALSGACKGVGTSNAKYGKGHLYCHLFHFNCRLQDKIWRIWICLNFVVVCNKVKQAA